jgi:hypothetical protein
VTGGLILTLPMSSRLFLSPTSPLSRPIGQPAQPHPRWHSCPPKTARNPPPTQTHALAPGS